jgi:beta-carotene hydroxylase
MSDVSGDLRLPPVSEIGEDLLKINLFQRMASLLVPFLCIAGYGYFALHHLWPAGVVCLVYLSFVTYGSVSHDLVHHTLGLPRILNEVFLTLIELLAFRSGHAYRQAHLHHHARFPQEDDIEGAASKMSFFRTLCEGLLFQWRIIIWAIARAKRDRALVIAETIGVLALLTFCFGMIRWTPIFAVYASLMIAGSWIIPLVTSYVPHNPAGATDLTQTRLFRGRLLSILALEHLYHLEHHLYPMVPHHHWPALARRLNPHFERAGIKPVILWF